MNQRRDHCWKRRKVHPETLCELIPIIVASALAALFFSPLKGGGRQGALLLVGEGQQARRWPIIKLLFLLSIF